jgi:hypothetical protein
MRQQVKCSREVRRMPMPRANLTRMIRLLKLMAREDVADRQCELVKGELPLVRIGLICPQLSVVADELPEQRA